LRDLNVEPNTDNRATSGVAADASFQNAIKPISDTVITSLDAKVVNFYDEIYSLEVADTEPRGEAEEAATAGQLYNDELITRNEGRRRVGEADVPDGDKFKQGEALKKEEDKEETAKNEGSISQNSGKTNSDKTIKEKKSQKISANESQVNSSSYYKQLNLFDL
jgi:hypothetical protein